MLKIFVEKTEIDENDIKCNKNQRKTEHEKRKIIVLKH